MFSNLSKRQRFVFGIFAVGIVFIVIGVSYALWQLVLIQTGENVLTTGCLKLTLTEQTSAINLGDATPISDDIGKGLNPYTFTLENVCTTETSYVVNLETLNSSDKILADRYVRAYLVSSDDNLFLDNLLDSYVNMEKAIEDSNYAYKLYQGTLGEKEKRQFSLRLWMDEDTPAIDEVMNASWQGKIAVIAKYIPPVDTSNMMIAMDANVTFELGMETTEFYNNTFTQNNKYVLSNVIYESSLNPYDNAAEIVDFSVDKDESVLGYYVKDADDEAYVLHIQANGKIKVNPKSSYYLIYDAYKTVDGIENLDFSEVTDMSNLFSYTDFTNLDLRDLNTSKVINMSEMFQHSVSLTDLNLSGWDTSNVVDMSNMFKYDYVLQNLNLDGFDTSNVIDMTGMFNDCCRLTSLDVSHFNTAKVTNMAYMFFSAFIYSTTNVTLDVSNFDTSNVIDMNSMFYQCKLTDLNLISFNTSKVTDMEAMFYGMHSLKKLTISSFDTSNVINMGSMFYDCNSLTNLDLSNLDTSNVADMSYMFYGCNGLINLDLSNFDTSNVADMSYMFYGCNSLINLDLSNFDTKNVIRMEYMFFECSDLTNLNISSFIINENNNMTYMFRYCEKLITTIDIINPNMKSNQYMFYNTATEAGAQVTINYTNETSDLVDVLIAQKMDDSNIVKGSLIS